MNKENKVKGSKSQVKNEDVFISNAFMGSAFHGYLQRVMVPEETDKTEDLNSIATTRFDQLKKQLVLTSA